MQFNEFEYHFACSRKDVHLCFDNLYSPPSGRKKEEKNNNNLTKLNYYNIHSTISFIMRPWQNDICSFRAMTVALTVSFKLISF